jgi:hypothetical protein
MPPAGCMGRAVSVSATISDRYSFSLQKAFPFLDGKAFLFCCKHARLHVFGYYSHNLLLPELDLNSPVLRSVLVAVIRYFRLTLS